MFGQCSVVYGHYGALLHRVSNADTWASSKRFLTRVIVILKKDDVAYMSDEQLSRAAHRTAYCAFSVTIAHV